MSADPRRQASPLPPVDNVGNGDSTATGWIGWDRKFEGIFTVYRPNGLKAEEMEFKGEKQIEGSEKC